MKQNAIERSIWIAAPRAHVWQAVTDPEQLAQWLLAPVGGAQMKSDADGTVFVCMGTMEIPMALFEDADPSRRITMRGLPIGCSLRPICWKRKMAAPASRSP